MTGGIFRPFSFRGKSSAPQGNGRLAGTKSMEGRHPGVFGSFQPRTTLFGTCQVKGEIFPPTGVTKRRLFVNLLYVRYPRYPRIFREFTGRGRTFVAPHRDLRRAKGPAPGLWPWPRAHHKKTHQQPWLRNHSEAGAARHDKLPPFRVLPGYRLVFSSAHESCPAADLSAARFPTGPGMGRGVGNGQYENGRLKERSPIATRERGTIFRFADRGSWKKPCSFSGSRAEGGQRHGGRPGYQKGPRGRQKLDGQSGNSKRTLDLIESDSSRRGVRMTAKAGWGPPPAERRCALLGGLRADFCGSTPGHKDTRWDALYCLGNRDNGSHKGHRHLS